MTSSAHAANAGFIEYGIHFRALTLRDYAELDVWMQDAYRKSAIATASQSPMSREMLHEYMATMHEYSGKLSTASADGQNRLRSVDGAEEVLRLASDGGFTRDRIAKQFTGDRADIEMQYANAIQQLLMRIKMLSISAEELADDGKPEEPGADPTPAAG